MTPAEAQTLRDGGLTYREIGERAGVSASTVLRWLSPEVAEQQRRAAREAKRRRQRPCEDCGRLKSYDNTGPLCFDCRVKAENAQNAERNEAIFAAWEANEPTAEIARRHGLTPRQIRSLVIHARAKGRDLKLHRRRDRELWPEIERRYHAGETYPQIGEALGITPENVNKMVRYMRAAGIDLPPRRRAAA